MSALPLIIDALGGIPGCRCGIGQQIGQGAIPQNSVAGFSHLLRQRLQWRAAKT
jgi:hypothetical protein